MVLTFGFTVQQLIEEGRLTLEEVEELKAWSEVEPTCPNFQEEQLACFILACDRDIKFTKKTIKEYLKAKRGGHNLFKNRSVELKELKEQLAALEYSVFPKRTEDGCAIIFHRLYDTYYANYSMEPAMKILFMTLDLAIREYPPTGLIVVFDMKGVGLMHLTRVRIGLVRQFFNYLQEGLAVKLKEIHVLNTVYFLDKVMAIIKPFIKKEIYNMLTFHPVGKNMDDFYENVPRCCLPEDFGGELPCLRVLHEENTRKMAEMREFFEEEENQW